MRVTVNEVSSHLCEILTLTVVKHIYRQDGDTTTSLVAPLQHVTTLRNLLKLRKASVNVQKRIRFPHDAQVEMAFIIEIMPIFLFEHLCSSPLTCSK